MGFPFKVATLRLLFESTLKSNNSELSGTTM